MSRKKYPIYVFIGPLILVVLWQLLVESKLAPEVLLPSPFKVLPYLASHFYTTLLAPMLSTVSIWLVGCFGAITVGLFLGSICGLNNKIYQSLEFSFDFFRSIPTMVYVPVAVILVGLGTKAQLLVIIFAVSLYPIIEVYYGIKYGRYVRKKLATIYKMSLWDELNNIIFPAAIPNIISGVRLSFNLSLIATVGTEMIMGGSHGLGRIILDSMITYNLTEMYAAICLIGILGYAINKIFLILESKLVHWKGRV